MFLGAIRLSRHIAQALPHDGSLALLLSLSVQEPIPVLWRRQRLPPRTRIGYPTTRGRTRSSRHPGEWVDPRPPRDPKQKSPLPPSAPSLPARHRRSTRFHRGDVGYQTSLVGSRCSCCRPLRRASAARLARSTAGCRSGAASPRPCKRPWSGRLPTRWGLDPGSWTR